MNGLVTFAKNVSFMFGKKRGRRPVFNSNMFYPHVAERELQGATREEFLRFIAEALAVAEIGTQFADDISELSDFDPKLPEDFVAEISKVAKEIEKKAMSSFSRQSEMIIGKPYYPPEVKGEILTNWESNFQMLCKSAETDAKKDIARLVQQGKNEGWNKLQLEKAVKSQLPGKYKNRAELIARTETAKLNTQINLETYRNIGIEYYTWMTTIDGRERESHAAMNGVICSVNDPDVYFEENPEDPLHPIQHARTGEMVHMHPGEDFQCRCSMVAWDPYINGKYEVKELPEEEPEKKEPTELEKANERLAEQEKELERAKNEAMEANERTKSAELKLNETEKSLMNEKKLRAEAETEAIQAKAKVVEVEKKIETNEKKWRDSAFSGLIKQAKSESIAFKGVETLPKKLSEKEIIKKICGIDKTFGSCSSLAFSYIANKKGLDVIDFRGGKSRNLFAENCRALCEPGGVVTSDYSELKASTEALKNVEEGKEYFFVAGSHATIVKKVGGSLFYLELQKNTIKEIGFKTLDEAALIERFDATPTVRGYKSFAHLVETDKLSESELFNELLGFMNTEKDKQHSIPFR